MHLYEDITNKNTTNLNQDVFENLFAYIRAIGANYNIILSHCNFNTDYADMWLRKHSSELFVVGKNTCIQNSNEIYKVYKLKSAICS